MSAPPHRPRVLLVGSFPPQAQGIPEYCGPLATALSAHADVTALGFAHMYPAALFPGTPQRFDPSAAPPAGSGLRLAFPLRWYHPLGWWWHALRTPADVVHVQFWSLPLAPLAWTFLVAARLRGLPCVLTVHNVLPHEASRGWRRAVSALCALADRVIVHTEENLRQAVDELGVAPEKLVRIPMPPRDVPRLDRADARTQLGLDADLVYVLAFGNIRPYKGLDRLLDAFAAIAPTIPDARLLIAGQPWQDWSAYEAQIDRLGLRDRVVLRLGHVPEAAVPAYFAAADLAVLPYRHFAGQSGIGAQAIAQHCPLLVSPVGGLPEWVDDNPQWMVADPAQWPDRLRVVLQDPARARAEFAVTAARVQEQRSWDVSALRHVGLYSSIPTFR